MEGEFPEYEEGDELTINGEQYEVVGIDPWEDGIRAYILDDGTDARIRLEPRRYEEMFGLIDVRGIDPDDVEVVHEG